MARGHSALGGSGGMLPQKIFEFDTLWEWSWGTSWHFVTPISFKSWLTFFMFQNLTIQSTAEMWKWSSLCGNGCRPCQWEMEEVNMHWDKKRGGNCLPCLYGSYAPEYYLERECVAKYYSWYSPIAMHRFKLLAQALVNGRHAHTLVRIFLMLVLYLMTTFTTNYCMSNNYGLVHDTRTLAFMCSIVCNCMFRFIV